MAGASTGSQAARQGGAPRCDQEVMMSIAHPTSDPARQESLEQGDATSKSSVRRRLRRRSPLLAGTGVLLVPLVGLVGSAALVSSGLTGFRGLGSLPSVLGLAPHHAHTGPARGSAAPRSGAAAGTSAPVSVPGHATPVPAAPVAAVNAAAPGSSTPGTGGHAPTGGAAAREAPAAAAPAPPGPTSGIPVNAA